MSINSAILPIMCYNQDVNCSIFCKVVDDLAMFLVVTLTCPWSKTTGPCSEILLSLQQTPFAQSCVKLLVFPFPVVYVPVSFTSLRAWGARVRSPCLCQLCSWVGRSLPPSPCRAVQPQLLLGHPWGAGGWVRISFPLKSVKSRRRSQRLLSGALLAEAPLHGLCCNPSRWAVPRRQLKHQEDDGAAWGRTRACGRAVLPWLLRMLPFTCRDEDRGFQAGWIEYSSCSNTRH